MAGEENQFVQFLKINNIPFQKGPVTGDLGSEAEIKVPEGYLFIDGSNANRFLEALGNLSSPNRKGALINLKQEWFLVFSFEATGYVKDDDKASLKPDELLAKLREGQDQANQQLKALNRPQLTLLGWAKEPFLDEETKNPSQPAGG